MGADKRLIILMNDISNITDSMRQMDARLSSHAERTARLERHDRENFSNSEHIDAMLSSHAERIARLEQCDGNINYIFASAEVVASLRVVAESSDQFALALEKLVYKDDPRELDVHIDKRTLTEDKVIFIRQCLLKYYNVPKAEAEDVWTKAKNALNRRVRELKKVTQAVQRSRSK